MDAESGSLTVQGNLSFLAPFYNEDSKASLPKEISDPQTLGDGAKSLSLPHTRFYSNTRRHPHHRLVRIADRAQQGGARVGPWGASKPRERRADPAFRMQRASPSSPQVTGYPRLSAGTTDTGARERTCSISPRGLSTLFTFSLSAWPDVKKLFPTYNQDFKALSGGLVVRT